MRASTTRAPSRCRSAAYASAAGLSATVGPSPTTGAALTNPTVMPDNRGAGTGSPLSTDHMSAASATVRAIGPTVSSDGTSGCTPAIGIRPHCGLSPTVPQYADGSRIEQPVSVPSPRSARPAASAAALPALEPPVVRPGRVGLRTVPYHGFWPITPHANSSRLALPTITAPASTSRCTAGALVAGTCSAYTREPYVVRSPAVSMRSLTTSVRPASGPSRGGAGSSTH